ncbi:Uncharacterised protein [Mesomycoplasma conjunctivae]|uniref:Uncharacterized protein n=1 Tax=Mesomycoplasma conjunctivae (strain ATCC 25834 / NCTC 10147 / HRC/581) TaxID=572263 RepID=C5J6W8_MESCH|nr:hypothetical protein [Mesomycoplasma conjunctivae]CAT05231.1 HYPOTHETICAL PROTEIN MCJ_005320 [Mesomycoplasma conjunctivae]VEU66452.1 Uncharacterised protein [Mesomycoplasma conjunctivae]
MLNFKDKSHLSFLIIAFVALIMLILGISLLVTGREVYANFVSAKIENVKDFQNVVSPTSYIYGVFSITIAILLIVLELLFANHLFNKKLNS